jgi:hypothetical protein
MSLEIKPTMGCYHSTKLSELSECPANLETVPEATQSQECSPTPESPAHVAECVEEAEHDAVVEQIHLEEQKVECDQEEGDDVEEVKGDEVEEVNADADCVETCPAEPCELEPVPDNFVQLDRQLEETGEKTVEAAQNVMEATVAPPPLPVFKPSVLQIRVTHRKPAPVRHRSRSRSTSRRKPPKRTNSKNRRRHVPKRRR